MAQRTIKLYANKWGYVASSSPSSVIDISNKDHFSLYRNTDKSIPSFGYVGFQSFPSNLSKKRLYSMKAVFKYGDGGEIYISSESKWYIHSGKLGIEIAESSFNPSTLVWSNRPSSITSYWLIGSKTGTAGKNENIECTMSGDSITDSQRSEMAAAFLRTLTACLFCASSGDLQREVIPYKTLIDGSTAPYIEITYDDSVSIGSNIKVATAPTSGYVNPRSSTSFSWIYEKDKSSGYDCVSNDFGQSSATFYWKKSSDETYTSIPISGAAKNVSVPANTFPAGTTIQWYVVGTDDGGRTSQTPVYSFSTAAGQVSTTLISPINSIESNNQPIRFRWRYSSADGFAPNRCDLWWKLPTEDNNSWHVIVESSTAITEYTTPAGFFPAGEIQWLVHAYNIDDVKGPDSKASFISYGAPAAPVVYAEAVPFTTVEWQADDQQAYQIKVDDIVYGPYFGTEKIFSIPDKLEDGEHTIGVSVVGTYGLWSEWGTATVTVQNVPGEEIVLGGVPGVDNFLSWTTAEETSDFLIFRDGVQIGHTARTTFADRYASGEHSYQVLNRLTDGNYSESNTVTLETTAAGTYITERVGGEWLEIKYSKMDMRDPEYEVSADGSFYHLAGDEWPSGSLSGHKESKVSFSALFLAEQETERKRFESLLGKEVILKFRDGTVFTTVLNNWKKELKKLSWTAYSFTLQRIETEDYVDDTT